MERAMTERYSAGDLGENVRGIPGAEYFSAIAEIWTRTVSQSAFLYSKAWDQLQAGNFGLSDVLKDATAMWQDQFRGLQDLLTVPFRQDREQWRYFQFYKAEPNALVERIALAARLDATAEIAFTPLHAIGAGTSSIVGSFEATWADERKAIDVRFDSDKLNTYPPGEYLGFIYNGAVSSGAPLVVMLLRIS
jgi:hypothetical protein